jgi:uncharacterized protein (TIGR03435 family)
MTLALAVIPAASQTPAEKPRFDVTSVKKAYPNPQILRFGSSGGRFVANNVPLRALLQSAYQLADGSPLLNDQIVGLPGWVDIDRFDVEGKAEGGPGPIPRERLQPMLQGLLEDRFRLKVHWEKREVTLYQLVVPKEKVKIRLSQDQTPPDSSQNSNAACDISTSPPCGLIQVLPRPGAPVFVLRGRAVPVSEFSRLLSIYTRRPVTDETHLNGLYDIELEFNPNSGLIAPPPGVALPDSNAPSIFVAVEEQLGLKLESARGPVEVLVIDSVQRPSEN